MQNCHFRTRISSLYRSQPSPVFFFAFTIATLWPELIVSIGPRPHLSLCACKTTRLTSELLVSMGPCLHLWFLHAKEHDSTRITSLHGSQTSPVVLCMQNNENRIRITSLYCSHTSSMVFWIQNSVFSTRIASFYGSQPSSVVFFHSQQRHYDQN